MNTKNRIHKDSTEKAVRDIRRATRRHYSAEEKIRIVLQGLRDEDSIAELCRKEGINQNLYYRWSKEFLEHYYRPGDLERRISQFVDYYKHERYHESLNNLTPADVFYGRGQQILNKQENIKLKTLALRNANELP
jgi:transposase-like protein